MKRSIVALALLLAAGPAGAGTEVATETRKQDGRARASLALFDGPRLRIDTHDGERSIVYRGDTAKIYVIDHRKQSYLEFDRPTSEALAGEVRSRIEELPPEKRAAVDVAAGVDPQVKVEDTGSRAKVLGIGCHELSVLQGGRRVADVCRASYADAGVERESFAAVREVQALLEGALAPLIDDDARAEGLAALESFAKLDGVPLRVRTYSSGSFESETVVTRIESKALPAKGFGVPDGYRPKLSITIRGN